MYINMPTEESFELSNNLMIENNINKRTLHNKMVTILKQFEIQTLSMKTYLRH
jgi:hypothetical protein